MPKIKLNPFLIVVLLVGLLCLPSTGLAAAELSVAELQKQARQSFAEGRYAEAEAVNLEIAEKHPGSEARRYAVQMLGSLYENNLVDLEKALKWHRVFLDEYADPRQVLFYREKLALLEQLLPQERTYAAYQAIRHANGNGEVAVEKLEALLAEHPDFLLQARVLKELAYAYARLDRRGDSYRAFQALSRIGGEEFTASDRMAYEKARRHWLRSTVGAGIAWGVVIIFSAAVLLMNPWPRMTRASLRTFVIWAVLWLLLAAARIPAYYAIEGEENLFHDAAVYVAAGLNLAVLFWVLLLTRGRFWQTRPRALLWLSPVLAVLMTTAVFYLFLIHQPNGAEIMDAFAGKYRHWVEAWQSSEPIL